MEKITVKGNELLADKYVKVRRQTTKLCSPLLAEDYVVQPVTDVSPPKWHLGHTTWFFETFVLSRFNKDYKHFNPAFNYIFNSYYESIGDRVLRTQRGNLTRPGVEEIYNYREQVDRQVAQLLENYTNPELSYLLELGLQHEQQHQELLLTDIKYILGHNPLFPIYKQNITPPDSTASNRGLDFIEIPEGIYEIGYRGNDFSFDNEKPVHKAYVNGFSIADRLVTNKEYLDFMLDGGYKNFRFWLAEGWEMVKALNWESPFYWMQKEGEWHEYTLAGLAKVNPDLPVTHVSFFEADAYANWAGKRLLGEAEWEVAARLIGVKSEKSNFLESGYYHTKAQEDTNQLFGDAWEWTYSAYHPYPGYSKAEGALGEYNGKFMINQIILRGGSCATPKDHIRESYRNFFHPDKRWQFTGIRLADKV